MYLNIIKNVITFIFNNSSPTGRQFFEFIFKDIIGPHTQQKSERSFLLFFFFVSKYSATNEIFWWLN